MALEIREMILRTTLVENNTGEGGKKKTANAHQPGVNTEYIIAECMERLMEWIKEEQER